MGSVRGAIGFKGYCRGVAKGPSVRGQGMRLGLCSGAKGL